LEKDMNQCIKTMFASFFVTGLTELNGALRGFKFDLRPEGTYMRNKMGILPLMEGNRKTLPRTLGESKEFPFLVLAPGIEAVTSSRSKSEMDKIKQGDLVVTDAGQTMVFLAAAKVRFPDNDIKKWEHYLSSRHAVLAELLVAPLAWVWFPDEDFEDPAATIRCLVLSYPIAALILYRRLLAPLPTTPT